MESKECYLSVGSAKRLIQLKPVLDASPGIAAVATAYGTELAKAQNCKKCPAEKQPPAFNLTNKLCAALLNSSPEAKKLVAGFLHTKKVIGHIAGSIKPVVLVEIE